MSRVYVLGAGLAGLAAAWRLLELRPDWQVTVLEKDPRAGGLASSMQKDGFRADLGPHRIFTELPEIEALLPELIKKEQAMSVPRRSELLLEGHLYRYPVRATELLGQMGPFRMGRLGSSAVLGKLRGLFSKPEDFQSAMEQAFGRGVYRLLIEPYTRKVWKSEPDQLSAEVARVRVSAGSAAQLLKRLLGGREKKGSQSALESFTYIRGGVEGLVKNLSERVTTAGGRVEVKTRAEGFEWDGTRLSAVRCSSNGQEEAAGRPGDFFISTMPLPELVQDLQKLKPHEPSQKAAQSLRFLGMILVGVILRRSQFTPNTWIYYPEEKYIFNRSYEPSNIDPSMSEPGRTMSVFEVTARHDSELWNSPDKEIAKAVQRDLIKTGLVSAEEIDSFVVQRLPYAYPLYTTGFEKQLATIFDYLGGFPNLVSTGRQGLFNHNNMDHSMLVGLRAGEYTSQGGEVAPRWYGDLGQFSHFRIVD